MLLRRGLIPEKYENNKQVRAKKDIDPIYNFLRQGHSNPKKVEMHDLETEKVDLYPSIYKSALAFNQNSGVIGMYNAEYGERRTRSKS